ncbi:hypothetical protein HO173_003377 [Letharia columbiana]|uniref:Fungal N-terminal domain-containing protein n=1 Tax=Letharia columbiana TaxID=112416 RepID=A0A8H6G0S5_9LECA|nr:uncharacterized protein HO173_003377 [Letharia columbiana]KAF6238410.1 hypothetical protein HO173_003377 [Letharia columbiana]
MEAVGGAASILAIAGAGIQISLKLIAFADQIGTASKRIQDVGTDVSVTAGTLRELGEFMNKKMPSKKSTAIFNPDQVQNIVASSTRCKKIFDELKNILGKASQQLRDVYKKKTKSQDASAKIKLSRLERMKWPFLQPSMESLKGALRDAKGTLTLILQVVHLRHAHTTASLDREEQNDLIRMIAAMRRQQLISKCGGGGGYQDLDAGDTEDSDSRNSSEVRNILEAWSVTPNTSSDESFQNFLITPIPISQQQIERALETSPQAFREIASMIDSLSVPERDAILGRVLGNNRSHPDDPTMRSISSQSWTGSHDLFGNVTSRKFRLIIERRVGISKSSGTNIKHKSPGPIHRQGYAMHEAQHYKFNSDPHAYVSYSDSDSIHGTEADKPEPSPSPPAGGNERRRRRRPARVPPVPSLETRRRPSQAYPTASFWRRRPDEWERKQDIDEKKHKEQTSIIRNKMIERPPVHQHEGESPGSQRWTEPQFASEPSDDELVRSLLAQYTNFELGEPLVQGIVTPPPPTYDEAFVIPKRVPQPY